MGAGAPDPDARPPAEVSMLKSFLMSGGLALALAIPVLRAPQSPAPGEPALELEVGDWLNHTGAAPTLSELRGKAVLIEFWATW